MKINAALSFAALLLASPAAAAPAVVADIPPVRALAAAIMGDAGAPALALRPGVSPHHAALRPSEAAALSGADIVFWIGPALTPALGRAAARLAPAAAATPLMEAPGVVLHPVADGDMPDPHIWLDPRNAIAMTQAMAETLAHADPARAADYRADADRAATYIAALEAELRAALAPYRGRPYVSAHDALGYFEARFGLNAAGTLAGADDAPPGPAQIAAALAAGRDAGATCVLTDPEHDGPLAQRVAEELGARRVRLDPLGADIAAGPEGYERMMRALADAVITCLGR